MSRQLIDLHCHILPGIDDGAQDIQTTAALLNKELADGVAGIVFTPHFNYERTTVETFVQARKASFRLFVKYAKEQELPLAAKLGAEVYFTRVLATLDLSQLAFSGTNYLLIELPTTYHPDGIDETLYEVMQKGYRPILAHVERYPYVTEDPTLLYNWVQRGSLAQINGAGLLRGGHTAKLLHQYIEWNLVHLVATDSHSMDHRPPNLKAAYAALQPATARAFARNAYSVYLGKELSLPVPRMPVMRFGHWF